MSRWLLATDITTRLSHHILTWEDFVDGEPAQIETPSTCRSIGTGQHRLRNLGPRLSFAIKTPTPDRDKVKGQIGNCGSGITGTGIAVDGGSCVR
jgi:hypothetical protein